MQYDNNSTITSVGDVKDFFNYLVYERDVNFHPDNDFEDYACYETHEPTFTTEECKLFNRLMEESFDICKAVGDENMIYEIGNDILWEWIRKNVA